MENVGIKVVGPVFDQSGYARATRGNIFSLSEAGLDVIVTPHCFERVQTAVGSEQDRELLASMVSSDAPYDIVIIQLTPDMMVGHLEPSKYNIAYFAWETTEVHPKWVGYLNMADEVWVPSSFVVEALKSSGVVKPVFKIPHPIDVGLFDGANDEDKTSLVGDTSFVFYSIFQWQPRKNPKELLRAYFNAFSASDDVCLLLKTYISEGTEEEQQHISNEIRRVKADMLLSPDCFPKVFLVSNKLSDSQVAAIHTNGDCCVSLHSSEGWGLVPFEAGLAGNPVIATGATGNMEFMTEDNSYPVDYQWEYVAGMSSFNGWYLGSGKWASPSQVHAAELMRHVFNNRGEAGCKARLLQSDIKSKYNYKNVGGMMKRRICEIRSSLHGVVA